MLYVAFFYGGMLLGVALCSLLSGGRRADRDCEDE